MRKDIEAFVENYRREFDYYYQTARLVHDRCGRLLAEAGIRAIVTFRAKSPDGLKAKLYQRAELKKYKTIDEMRGDIVDLSGVRIALYFPSDRSAISTILRKEFIVDNEIEFPKESKRKAAKFAGYHANHFRVTLNPSNLSEDQHRFSGCGVEIQVASVLMHAWSEVEHDLSYKKMNGELSDEELSILDGLNGLVLSGEVFLERLQAALVARVSKSGTTFSNQFELAGYLYERMRVSEYAGADEPSLGRVDLLFALLREAQMLTLDDVDFALGNVEVEAFSSGVADHLTDAILSDKPDPYPKYLLIKSKLDSGSSIFASELRAFDGRFGSFLRKWGTIDRFLFTYARIEGKTSRLIPVSLIDRLAPPEFSLRVKAARDIRNGLVHGKVAYHISVIEEAEKSLDDILEHWRQSTNVWVQEALNLALSAGPVITASEKRT